MRLTAPLLTFVAFLVAAALSLLMAMFVAGALEARSIRHVTRALLTNDLTWAEVSADGLLVTLTGTAPTEALRFRAASVAGRVVGANRVIDAMEVTPAKALTAPRFSVELLRNDDGISMIGLVPSAWDTSRLVEAAETLAAEGSLANMLETADFAIPSGWVEATDFGMVALRLLPRSKISVAADRVQVTAISDSPAQKRRFEADLGRALPANVPVDLSISAPRPVIAPFTLRFVIDADGPRFDACAADSDRARSRILAAASRAGVPGTPACTLGLGAPSPRWAEAAEAVIAAMAELGAGSVTISDVDITLNAAQTVAQGDFDRVVGELTARLPDVFSLKATLTPRPQTEGAAGVAQFTATRSPEGAVQLRGRLADDRMRAVVEAFARARFGAANVYVATRLDDTLPPGWGVRVLAGLAGLAELASGAVLVEPERVQIKGTTGNQGARADISRILSEQLGQGAVFAVDVAYDERLDPQRGLPTPQECLALASAVLERRQISFAPNKAEIAGEAVQVVADLAKALADCGGIPLEIGGHTDSQGRAETNQTLSQKRAEAVLKALAGRGLDTSDMTARGYGAAEPIADNATEAGRVANRRIAFKLRPAKPTEVVIDPAQLIGLIEDDQPEDDGEAKPTPPARPDSLIPFADDAEGAEPMGDAGDLEVADDGTPILPAPATPPVASESGAGTETLPPPAPVVEAAPRIVPSVVDPALEPDAADVADPAREPVVELPPTPQVDTADLVRSALGADAPADATDWQSAAPPTELRPLPRPEGVAP